MLQLLAERKLSSGVITNDQAPGLVDTAIGQATGAKMVAEVADGCFCCRLEDLVKVLTERRSAGSQASDESNATPPDVIIAEPVGSCTDLVSTVPLLLGKVYQVPFDICRLSVVVDGRRALSNLGTP